MTNTSPILPWTDAAWFAEASAWMRAALERQGITMRGTVEQTRVRPWSTILRAPTSVGDIYFKAMIPSLAHEPALTAALSRWRPDCMLEVVATDVTRGWMLMRDAGVTLRSLVQTDGDVHHWHTVLRLYANVQSELADHRDELLALGAFDRRLAVLPAKFAHVLADTDILRIDQPNGLTADEYRLLSDGVSEFGALCADLARFPIPETVHHDDFHDGNIFVHDGRYTFGDWGESCVAHPFFTLIVTLRSIAYRRGWDGRAAQITELRDRYLDSWTRMASHAQLQAAFQLAHRVGMVSRALTWYRVASSLEEPHRTEHATSVVGWLQEYLNAQAT